MSFGIYETVTNRIIAELEAGAIPWTQPWKNQKSGGVMPLNRATGRPYSGINIPILCGAASAFDIPPINGSPQERIAEAIDRFTEIVGFDRYALYVFDYG